MFRFLRHTSRCPYLLPFRIPAPLPLLPHRVAVYRSLIPGSRIALPLRLVWIPHLLFTRSPASPTHRTAHTHTTLHTCTVLVRCRYYRTHHLFPTFLTCRSVPTVYGLFVVGGYTFFLVPVLFPFALISHTTRLLHHGIAATRTPRLRTSLRYSYGVDFHVRYARTARSRYRFTFVHCHIYVGFYDFTTLSPILHTVATLPGGILRSFHVPAILLHSITGYVYTTFYLFCSPRYVHLHVVVVLIYVCWYSRCYLMLFSLFTGI